jgi:hypothetical protein
MTARLLMTVVLAASIPVFPSSTIDDPHPRAVIAVTEIAISSSAPSPSGVAGLVLPAALYARPRLYIGHMLDTFRAIIFKYL